MKDLLHKKTVNRIAVNGRNPRTKTSYLLFTDTSAFQQEDVYIYIYIYMYVCVCVCVYTHTYIYLYIYIYLRFKPLKELGIYFVTMCL